MEIRQSSAQLSPSLPKLLAVSFAYPPLAYPRSIQVARLLKNTPASTVIVCADEPSTRHDPTIESDAEAQLEACLRVRFVTSARNAFIRKLSHRLYRSLWIRQNMVPDYCISWKPLALKAIDEYLSGSSFVPDIVATFGQPFTDHLIGLELKRRLGLPWLAHFSDPWVDNPFNKYDTRTRKQNLILERQVIESADLLAFNSTETIDLVLKKYSPETKHKARILPHSFEPTLFESSRASNVQKLVVRYIGDFYGNRTPLPLIKALGKIYETNNESLKDVCFEFVGVCDTETIRQGGGDDLPKGLLQIRKPVEYQESIRLMSDSDGLLVIDAPADFSVFLPSKLVDYVGAGRPVLGITPPGTAERLIRELGGFVVDPMSELLPDTITTFLNFLRARPPADKPRPWGIPEVRGRYDPNVVASSFANMLAELKSTA